MSTKRSSTSTPPPTNKRTKSDAKVLPSVRSIAEKALALAAKANRAVEKKAIDFNGNSLVGTTAVAFHFTAIAQGTAQNQRIGNSVYLTGMAINYYWLTSASAVATQCRFIVFMDTQTQSDDTAIAWTEVMDNSSILAMINRGSQRNRFKMLYDKHVFIDRATKYTDNNQKIYFPINKVIEYNSTASSDIQKNAVYGLCLSDDNTNQPAFNYYARMYFRDS